MNSNDHGTTVVSQIYGFANILVNQISLYNVSLSDFGNTLICEQPRDL